MSCEQIHISAVRVGDCVDHDGKVRTVGKADLKRGFMGITLFGDSYRLGTVAVTRVDPRFANPR